MCWWSGHLGDTTSSDFNILEVNLPEDMGWTFDPVDLPKLRKFINSAIAGQNGKEESDAFWERVQHQYTGRNGSGHPRAWLKFETEADLKAAVQGA